jgi:hypothetical protein
LTGLAGIDPDIIIASDVVFDPELCTALAGVLHGLLTAPKHCEAYIASTERNPETLAGFLTDLREAGLSVTSLPLPAGDAVLFPRSDDFPVEFHHVRAFYKAGSTLIQPNKVVGEGGGDEEAGGGGGEKPIRSGDFAAWDTFDVDAALKKVDLDSRNG